MWKRVWSYSDNKSALSRLGQKDLSCNSFIKALLENFVRELSFVRKAFIT